MRLLALLFLCSTLPAAATAERPRVGVVLGQTGAGAHWTKAQLEGVTLAVEELGERAPVIIIEDSATDPKRAISAFHKLLSSDRVQFILGDIFSNISDALIPLAKGKPVTLVSPSSPASTCRADIPNYFTISAQVAESYGAWEAAFRTLKIKRIATVYFDNPTWGAVYKANWDKAAAAAGAQVVSSFANTDLISTNFGAVMPKVLAASPDSIMLAHSALPFLRAADELHFAGRIVSANHVLEYLHDPSAAELLEGVYVVDSRPDAAFTGAFAKRFNHPPVLEPQTSYEAIRAISAAWAAGKQTLAGIHYRGAAGEIDFRGTCAGNKAHWNLFRISASKLMEQ